MISYANPRILLSYKIIHREWTIHVIDLKVYCNRWFVEYRFRIKKKEKKKEKRNESNFAWNDCRDLLVLSKTGINPKLGRLLFREAKRKSDRHASSPHAYIRRVTRSFARQSIAGGPCNSWDIRPGLVKRTFNRANNRAYEHSSIESILDRIKRTVSRFFYFDKLVKTILLLYSFKDIKFLL